MTSEPMSYDGCGKCLRAAMMRMSVLGGAKAVGRPRRTITKPSNHFRRHVLVPATPRLTATADAKLRLRALAAVRTLPRLTAAGVSLSAAGDQFFLGAAKRVAQVFDGGLQGGPDNSGSGIRVSANRSACQDYVSSGWSITQNSLPSGSRSTMKSASGG